MADTIGAVQFIVGLDGRRLPAEARRLANQIGREGTRAGDDFSRNFSRSFSERLDGLPRMLSDRMSAAGNLAGERFSDTMSRRLRSGFSGIQDELAGALVNEEAFRKFAQQFDSPEQAARKLRQTMAQLRQEHVLVTQTVGEGADAYQRQVRMLALTQREQDSLERSLSRYVQTLRSEGDAAVDLLGRQRELAEARGRQARAIQAEGLELRRSREDLDGIDRAIKELGDSLRTTGLRWQDLGHNTRQWTLIIGVVAAAMQNLATLGSAAGGGLLAVGGAAAQAVVGIGGLVPVFSRLNEDLENLPPELRDAAREFQDFRGTLKGLGDDIAAAAFPTLEGVFDSLGETVGGLTPSFQKLGRQIGLAGDRLANSLRPGTEAFGQLNQLVENSADGFDDLANIGGSALLALVRGFNKAQPLVEDLYGWLGQLIDRFDAFTRSNQFDHWVANTSELFEHFGGLLDATGRALNDLVTPAAFNRTNDFLDNLTGFMPSLSQLLDILGRLDLFGLLAQGLNDFGMQLSDIAEPLGELAEAISRVASIAIAEFAEGVGLLASALAPTVQLVADFLNWLSPETIEAFAAGVLVLAGAFVTLRGAAGIGAAMTALDGFIGKAGKAVGASKSLTTAISGFVGKAGLFGLVAGGAVAAGGAISALIDSTAGWSEKAKEAVASGKGLSDSARDIWGEFSYLGKTIEGTTLTADNLEQALDRLTAENANGGEFWAAWSIGASEFSDEAHDLRATLGKLDPDLANLAKNNLPAASEQFAVWAEEANASNEEILAMLDSMPQFKQALEDTALAQGEVATEQDLVTLALKGMTPEMEAATKAADENAKALADLEGKAVRTGDEVDDLSDKIRDFGSVTLTTRDAERQFEQAIDDLSEALLENGAALNEQGTEFDLTTDAGRKNQAAVDDLATSTLELAASIYEETGNQADATDAIRKGRDALVEQMKQMGFTEAAAEAYVDELGLIPENIKTYVSLQDKSARSAVDSFIRDYNGRQITVHVRADGSFNLGGGRFSNNAMASGGTLYGPTRILAGEAGPEAIVPLRRSLSQVDPSVRWLSAIAQGKGSTTAMASGGIAAGGRNVTVAPGAVAVYEAGSARQTAYDVLDVLANRIAG